MKPMIDPNDYRQDDNFLSWYSRQPGFRLTYWIAILIVWPAMTLAILWLAYWIIRLALEVPL